MHRLSRQSIGWLASWAALVLLGAAALVRYDIGQRREAFKATAQRAHALLSQRTAEHDAILATLALLGPAIDQGDRPEQRLPAVYPQLLAVLRRDRDSAWPAQGEPANAAIAASAAHTADAANATSATDPAEQVKPAHATLAAAEAQSRALSRAVPGPQSFSQGQYTLVLAGTPISFALRIDLRRLVPWPDWPLTPDGPVQATLSLGAAPGAETWPLQPGQAVARRPFGLTAGFVFQQPLATASQPFVLRLQLATGPAEWPWRWLLSWLAGVTLLLVALASRGQVRRERHRLRELQRIGQVSRLNSLGELAAGMAHELNQPLAAVLANTQAAQRLLRDDPPELDTAQQAMAGAATQARRAADVLNRLRRLVQRPDEALPLQPVSLTAAARHVVDLLEQPIRQRGVRVAIAGRAADVSADPVALEQILFNLVHNALQAMDAVPPTQRQLTLQATAADGHATLAVHDSGPGIPPAALPHVFEPFFSGSDGASGTGLGLGLSLCESLAQAMHGSLTVHAASPTTPRGAEFRLRLPLAVATAAAPSRVQP